MIDTMLYEFLAPNVGHMSQRASYELMKLSQLMIYVISSFEDLFIEHSWDGFVSFLKLRLTSLLRGEDRIQDFGL